MAEKNETEEKSNEPRGKKGDENMGDNGYPETDVKTTGIITRGNGCATKGLKARGPMG
jgi:hypothetical protein